MNDSLQEYDVVRIVKLINPSRNITGMKSVSRPPKIGDVATVCHYYPESPFIVEMVDQDGMTIWLADFVTEELELVERPSPRKKSI